MIKEKFILLKGHPRNKKYYENLGYNVIIGSTFSVNVLHLSKGCSTKITSICDICGNESNNCFKDYWNYTNGVVDKYYCNLCNKEVAKQTCIDRYGVNNPMKSDKVKKKLKKSILDKYGVDHYSKTDEYKIKYKKTCMDRYGKTNTFQVDEFKESSKKTNLKNLGVEYPMQSKDVIGKSRKTFFENWGKDWYSKTKDWKKRSEEISMEKYGVNHYSKTDEYKQRCINTNDIIWGGHPSKNEFFKTRSKISKERKTHIKYSELISEKYDTVSYHNEEFKILHIECNKEFSISKGLLSARYTMGKCICVECNPVGVQYSFIESEIYNFIKEMCINCERNRKDLIKGEIDIYLPDHNIGIEVNGIYWHSEIFKPSNYHLDKTMQCKKSGIDLLHIWEDDWQHKRDIVKSIIKNRMGVVDKKIGARKCSIDIVGAKEYRQFLDENHIQGFSSCSIAIGLYSSGTLVSLMTFGWRRTNNKKEYELIRFCNKKHHSIMGSASKLFNFFLNNHYDGQNITSYEDISLFSGSLYSRLGFDDISLSDPNYFWVVDGVRKHRYNFSKRKLVNDGFDKNMTEVEIMHSRGYYRIYSSGQKKWVYSISIC